MVATRLLTVDEFMVIPDADTRYELIEGVLREVSAAAGHSSAVAVRIGTYLSLFVNARRLGLVTGADGSYVLQRGPDTVRLPDVAFTRAERVRHPDDVNRAIEGSPDLVVKVWSPTDTIREIEDKLRHYLAAGSAVAWLFHPLRRRVTIITRDGERRDLAETDTLDGGDVLANFRVPVREFFLIQEPVRVELVLPSPPTESTTAVL